MENWTKKIKYISFDLDDTLASENYDKTIWNKEIPKLYAKKHKISLEEAKTKVYAEYYQALYIEKIKTWTDIQYWFERFGLDDWKKLLEDMGENIFVFEDTIETLDFLSKDYKIIIVSNAEEKFLNIKIKAEGLSKYIIKTYSAPCDFQISKKNKKMFKNILEELEISEKEIIHIGDDKQLDYEIPRELGIRTFLIDRTKKEKGENILHSLTELKDILKKQN